MKSKEFKILWISDIHFSVKYEEAFKKKPALELYFANFFNKINEIVITDGRVSFDYIFLTGDLAQAGLEADYKLLFIKFLKPLFDLLLTFTGSKPRVIVIPGNHDVDWQKSEFLKEYVKKIEPGKKEPVERAAYLADNTPEFKKLFTDYRKFLMEYVVEFDGGKYKDFFCMDNNLEFKVSPEYQEHRLFGYLVDHERRLIVNLVNTAWYSLGGRFNNILADLEADPTNWNIYHVETGNKAENPTVGDILRKHTAARLKRVLNKKEYISEYNSQITGINLFELSDMQTTQKEYSEYFVITCLHHPFNWLKWDEQYAFDDKGDDTNAKRLSKLIGLSNLILTGHEHVPKQVKGEMKSNSCVMLKSGCFLFDNQHSDEGNLENGWFSVLHIDSDRATVRQDKHYYVVKEHSGNWDDLKSDRSKTGYYKLRKKNAGYPDKGERLQEISKMVNNTSVEQLFALLNTLFEADERAINVELISSIPEAKFFRVERTGLANLTEICIIVRTENAYDVLRKESFCEQLISLAADVRAKVSIFRFVILDLFIDPPDLSRMAPHLQEKYSFKERSSQLQLKTLIADDMFDIMRYEMFVNFEKRFASSGNLPSEFELIRDAMFVNTIVPFWVAENIWRSAKIRV